MSKINAVRLINVNYNNNAYRISDETLHFNGKSTLISLQNGGGKSVLVQMLTAPFVHPKYRNTKDRLFESYCSHRSYGQKIPGYGRGQKRESGYYWNCQ